MLYKQAFKPNRMNWIYMAVVTLFVVRAEADPRCFSFAETYYEQLYCEIKSQNPRASLPDFMDFKRNPAMTQALLLKPLARSQGIRVALPKRSNTVKRRGSVPAPDVAGSRNDMTTTTAKDTKHASCVFSVNTIRCGAAVYQLQGNQQNSDLADDALSASNRLRLPEFVGVRGDEAAEQRYLLDAYSVYLEKMLLIGLGGATLNYGKFAYLFYDLHEKGVSFAGRFEKMYEFLKQDKRNIQVSTAIRVPGELSGNDCYFLNAMWVCSVAGFNYLYPL